MKSWRRGFGGVFALGLIGTGAVAPGATVAYWRFEKGPTDNTATATVPDLTANQLGATPFGLPVYRAQPAISPVPQTAAPNNYSLEFNPTTEDGAGSQRLYVPDNPVLALTHSLTLEAYVDVYSSSANPNVESQIIFRGDDRGGLDPYYLEIRNNQVRFQVTGASGAAEVLSAPLPGLHQWVHLAGTLDDATGQMRLYINGIRAASTTTTLRPLGLLDPTQNAGLGIGNVQSGNVSEYFHGLIDEVRISDAALTPGEFLMSPQFPDCNGNGVIDFGDLLAVAQHYGHGDAGFQDGDFNSDGQVGFSDLLVLAQRYGDHFINVASTSVASNGAVSAASSAVPEPVLCSATMLAAALLGIRARRAKL